MTSRTPPDMVEAARLTRRGKLADATALIQRLLHGKRFKAGEAKAQRVVDVTEALKGGEPDFDGLRPREGLGETLQRLAEIGKNFDRGKGPLYPKQPVALPDGASFSTGSYSNLAGMRKYKLYVPSKRSGAQIPLIVMLHGCSQSPDDFAVGTQMNAIAEEHGFLVAYPAQHAMANPNYCWNWFKPEDQARGQGEPSLIAGITEQVMRRHAVDPARIFVAGLSAGGAAAAIMGEAYPELYAAVGVHSGLAYKAAGNLSSALDAMRVGTKAHGKSSRITPTIVFHGDRDVVVHPSNADAVTAHAIGSAPGSKTTRTGTANGQAYSCTTYSDREGRTVCENWTLQGAGHAWSGGNPSGSHTDRRGPDASREMLRFFLAHPRPI